MGMKLRWKHVGIIALLIIVIGYVNAIEYIGNALTTPNLNSKIVWSLIAISVFVAVGIGEKLKKTNNKKRGEIGYAK